MATATPPAASAHDGAEPEMTRDQLVAVLNDHFSLIVGALPERMTFRRAIAWQAACAWNSRGKILELMVVIVQEYEARAGLKPCTHAEGRAVVADLLGVSESKMARDTRPYASDDEVTP